MDVILQRRSIRRFEPDPIPEETVRELLRAAMSAPSAGDERPWQFVVLDDRGILDRIPTVHPYAEAVRRAPLAILVCGDLSRERHEGFWVQDCAAATENLLLAVTAKGLGAVWLGVHPRPDRVTGFRRLLGIPENVVPFALVPLGRPAERKPREDRFDAGRVHRNGW
jgi:nitroreductase